MQVTIAGILMVSRVREARYAQVPPRPRSSQVGMCCCWFTFAPWFCIIRLCFTAMLSGPGFISAVLLDSGGDLPE